MVSSLPDNYVTANVSHSQPKKLTENQHFIINVPKHY